MLVPCSYKRFVEWLNKLKAGETIICYLLENYQPCIPLITTEPLDRMEESQH